MENGWKVIYTLEKMVLPKSITTTRNGIARDIPFPTGFVEQKGKDIEIVPLCSLGKKAWFVPRGMALRLCLVKITVKPAQKRWIDIGNGNERTFIEHQVLLQPL